MANVNLTPFLRHINDGIGIASREMVGLIPAIEIDSRPTNVAMGTTLKVLDEVQGTVEDVVSGNTYDHNDTATLESIPWTFDKQRRVKVSLDGDSSDQLRQEGLHGNYLSMRFADAFRQIINEAELDVANKAKIWASRAVGTPGVPPFSTDFDLIADVARELDENGAPLNDRTTVVNSLATANLRKLTGLNQVYAAGTDATLRQGTILPISNIDLKQSLQIKEHTGGTGTGYNFTAGGAVAGDKILNLEGGNSGTILPGDLALFDNDVNRYVVQDGGTASGAAAGTITIQRPGLRAAHVDIDAMGALPNYTPNLAFHRMAIKLGWRFPKLPDFGNGPKDSAVDRTYVSDPVTGLVFEVSLYVGERIGTIEIAAAWGVGIRNPRHIMILAG